jgi:hypothetical protein
MKFSLNLNVATGIVLPKPNSYLYLSRTCVSLVFTNPPLLYSASPVFKLDGNLSVLFIIILGVVSTGLQDKFNFPINQKA